MDIKKTYFKIGRNSEDAEKALLPTLMFINSAHKAFGENRRPGFMLCIGWWDYSVKFGLFFSGFNLHF